MSLNGSQLFDRLESAKEQLAWAEFLELSEAREPPAGEQAVSAMETALGARLPEPLRSFWATVAHRYGYYVKLTEKGRREVDSSAGPAQLEIVALTALRRRARGGRELIAFTDDGHGNGWALDVTMPPDAAGNVVWFEQDAPDTQPPRERRPSLDALFDELEESYFLGGEIAEILEEWLPRPTRRRPATVGAAARASVRPAPPPARPASVRPRATAQDASRKESLRTTDTGTLLPPATAPSRAAESPAVRAEKKAPPARKTAAEPKQKAAAAKKPPAKTAKKTSAKKKVPKKAAGKKKAAVKRGKAVVKKKAASRKASARPKKKVAARPRRKASAKPKKKVASKRAKKTAAKPKKKAGRTAKKKSARR